MPHTCPPPLLAPCSLPPSSAPTRMSVMINGSIPKNGWKQVTWAYPSQMGSRPSTAGRLGLGWGGGVPTGKGLTGPGWGWGAPGHSTPSSCPWLPRVWGCCWGGGVGGRGPGLPPTWPLCLWHPCPSGRGRLPVPIPTGRKRKGPPVLPARVAAHPAGPGPLPACSHNSSQIGGGGLDTSHCLDPLSSWDPLQAFWLLAS